MLSGYGRHHLRMMVKLELLASSDYGGRSYVESGISSFFFIIPTASLANATTLRDLISNRVDGQSIK